MSEIKWNYVKRDGTPEFVDRYLVARRSHRDGVRWIELELWTGTDWLPVHHNLNLVSTVYAWAEVRGQAPPLEPQEER